MILHIKQRNYKTISQSHMPESLFITALHFLRLYKGVMSEHTTRQPTRLLINTWSWRQGRVACYVNEDSNTYLYQNELYAKYPNFLHFRFHRTAQQTSHTLMSGEAVLTQFLGHSTDPHSRPAWLRVIPTRVKVVSPSSTQMVARPSVNWVMNMLGPTTCCLPQVLSSWTFDFRALEDKLVSGHIAA